MTHPIPTGDTLEMRTPEGKLYGRMVHLGNGVCKSERFCPERGPTGGLTNSGSGTWEISKKDMVLTEAQVAEWLKRKSA